MQLGLENYSEKDSYVKNSKKIKGKYGFIVVLKYNDGTEKTQQHAGFSTIEDADYERDIILGQIRGKKYLVYGSTLLKDYIIHWLEDDFKVRVEKYSSYYSYNSVVNNHIIPVLGNKMMRTINTADIHRLYKRVSDYSPSVAKQVKTIMTTFLDVAVEEFAIEINVAKDVRLPKCVEISKNHMRKIDVDKTLSEEQALRLIEGSRDSVIHIMILFNVVMGLRCSEIIGLKYSDVDFVNKKLSIRRQLGRDIHKEDAELDAKTYTKQEIGVKTSSSNREIDIPDIVFDAILKQRKKYNACKSRRSASFKDWNYICCSSYGRPRSRNYHFKEYKRLLKELGLPDIRWHDLRGTCATLLLMQGLSPKAVAENLGHAKEIVTVDHYIDNTRLSVIKLDRLDEFIDSVKPVPDEDKEKDLSHLKVDISEYFMKVEE